MIGTTLSHYEILEKLGPYPLWNPNGKELFFRNRDKMMAVEVQTEGDLVLKRPTMLFERHFLPWEGSVEVAKDGQRFLGIDESVVEPAPRHLALVQNFGEELKRLVPVKD
jgi:hypothetical protein